VIWGPAGEATDSDFRARAGALTLLYVCGSMEREDLLELLAEAQGGGLLSPSTGVVPDDDDIAAEEREEREAEEVREALGEEEYGEYEEEGGMRLRTTDPLTPEPLMRTTAKGEEFLFIAFAMERWLEKCPGGPLELGPRGARALAPLICCWSATVTHALAPAPLTIEELDRAVQILDRPTVEEHLEALERSGQVREVPDSGSARYALTDWGREGISPIVAAVRYERRYPERDVLPPDVFDIEAAFQMALPLLSLPPELCGDCRLGVQIPGGEPLMAGASVRVERGCVMSSTALLGEQRDNFVTGAPIDWCETVIEPHLKKLICGGDPEVTNGLIAALHERLFGDIPPEQRFA